MADLLDILANILAAVTDALVYFSPLELTRTVSELGLGMYEFTRAGLLLMYLGGLLVLFGSARNGEMAIMLLGVVGFMCIPLILGGNTGAGGRHEYVWFAIAGLFRALDGFACRRGLKAILEDRKRLLHCPIWLGFALLYLKMVVYELESSPSSAGIVLGVASIAVAGLGFLGVSRIASDVSAMLKNHSAVVDAVMEGGFCLFVLAAFLFRPESLWVRLLYYLTFPCGVVFGFAVSHRRVSRDRERAGTR